MKKIFPKKLKKGSHVRVIAPADSMFAMTNDAHHIAKEIIEKEFGLRVSFGKNIEKRYDEVFDFAIIEERVEDLHEAFLDSSVDTILTVWGGYNSNQLLRYIDWDVIKNNPKIFCGISDITALNVAIYTKTGLVTYNGLDYYARIEIGQKKSKITVLKH